MYQKSNWPSAGALIVRLPDKLGCPHLPDLLSPISAVAVGLYFTVQLDFLLRLATTTWV